MERPERTEETREQPERAESEERRADELALRNTLGFGELLRALFRAAGR